MFTDMPQTEKMYKHLRLLCKSVRKAKQKSIVTDSLAVGMSGHLTQKLNRPI